LGQWPVYWDLGLPQTGRSYEMLWNYRSATLNWNFVWLAGPLASYWYFDAKPNVAHLVRRRLGTQE